MKDPKLFSRFQWDARRLYKYDAKTKAFVRFYDEPWTGDLMWEMQARILPAIRNQEMVTDLLILSVESWGARA